jgi:hypothetical protein
MTPLFTGFLFRDRHVALPDTRFIYAVCKTILFLFCVMFNPLNPALTIGADDDET